MREEVGERLGLLPRPGHRPGCRSADLRENLIQAASTAAHQIAKGDVPAARDVASTAWCTELGWTRPDRSSCRVTAPRSWKPTGSWRLTTAARAVSLNRSSPPAGAGSAPRWPLTLARPASRWRSHIRRLPPGLRLACRGYRASPAELDRGPDSGSRNDQDVPAEEDTGYGFERPGRGASEERESSRQRDRSRSTLDEQKLFDGGTASCRRRLPVVAG